MGSLSRLSQVSPSPSENYLIYAPLCSRNPNADTISTFIERYNPSNNSWSRVTSIPLYGENTALKDFATMSIGHHIYIIGGRVCQKLVGLHDADFLEEFEPMVVSSVHKYNIRTDNWETCAPMSTPRFNFACIVSNGKIYVAGGQSTLGQAKGIAMAEIYDPALDEWKSIANMSTKRYKCVGVMFQDKIHVIGGFVDGGENPGPFIMTRSSAEVYDEQRDRWVFRPRMWELDVPPNQILQVNGKLFSSGDCFMPWKGHTESYDEKQFLWNVVPGSHSDCLCPTFTSEVTRSYLTMAAIGNKLFFLAGYRMSGAVPRFRSEVHVFDTAANGGGWLSNEPIEEDGEKELCSHCCVLRHES